MLSTEDEEHEYDVSESSGSEHISADLPSVSPQVTTGTDAQHHIPDASHDSPAQALPEGSIHHEETISISDASDVIPEDEEEIQ